MKLKKNGRFGGETFVMGEALTRVSSLNGMRVQVAGEEEIGTVYNVYVNPDQRLAQIWVNMDTGGARCFRPHHLTLADGQIFPNLLSTKGE
jgi:hypothetical protein